jgi:ferritin-like metal-binding protein YciE
VERAWAAKPGHKQAVILLDQTLQQEKKTDVYLTMIARSAVKADAETIYHDSNMECERV